MPDYITQSAKLAPYAKRPKQGNGYVNVYTHEPAPDSVGANLGNLYVVSEALVGGRASEDLIDIIIATFGENYYNHGGEQPFPLARFEHAVKTTNKELAAYVDRGNASWIGKLSSIIAIVTGDEVHIAHTGSAEGFLSRGKTTTRITTSEPGRPATPTRTFSSIASGELEVGDRLLFCTPALVHHLPAAKLSSVVLHSSPNTAISELTSLLKGAQSDRVGAIICEITTPELAAAQLRSDQPSEIELGAPENAFQAAKLAATPLAESTLTASLSAKNKLVFAYRILKPALRQFGLKAAATIRALFSRSWGRRLVAIALIIVIVCLGFGWWVGQKDQHTAQLFQQYQQLYADFTAPSNPSSTAELSRLQVIKANLNKLASNQKEIDHELANSNLIDHEPTTFAAFTSKLANQIDSLSGLVTRHATLLKDLSSPNQIADHFEIIGNKLVLFSQGKSPSIRLFNTTTAAITQSTTNLATVGKIVATTPTASNDGVYLLTDSNGVWLYTLSTDTLVAQTISYGSWPTGSAIGAFASNLYILSGDTIFKFVHSATGFSPRTTYLSLSGDNAGATALAIDGSVYTLNPNQLTEFVAGVPQGHATLPISLPGISNLRSAASGKLLLAVQPSTNRIISFARTASGLAFEHQIAVSGISNIADCIYQPTTNTILVLANNQLLSLSR